LPFSLLFTVLCYLTNWFVCLFADRNGELHGLLHLWQTWDDSLNGEFSVQCAPKLLRYDWQKHYREYLDTTQYLRSVNRDRWFAECINDEWTLWERFQRYACRVLWLMRNNAYGFSFYLLGHTATPPIDVTRSENTISAKERNGFGWSYKNTAKIFSMFGWEVHWNNYLGWKLDLDAEVDTRGMIANRVAFFFRREGE
jgi:hypothetical protein